jgi:S-(hydroxymethyl)glutathione dehydrogenase/alcohol dehydrogenase
MKAAVLYEVNKPLVIEDVSLQKPGPREVLIRTSVAGLCHSDLHFMEGLYPHPLPAVLGHESAGVVEQVGSDVTYVKPGDHVVTCLSVFCGTCDNCSTGRPVLCTDTTVKLMPGVSNRLSWARVRKSSTNFSTCRRSPSRCWCTKMPSSRSARTCRWISRR